ncbi:hypothetical protein HRbin36_01680 [bacterium HR36]|nr:hypothetical protein HRbin36_01680 [bacterium HR36]
MVVFDWVFDGDDVAVVVFIEPVDHAGQTGRLAGTGRAGHQQQTARSHDQSPNRLRHTDLFKGQELARNAPQHDTDAATLFEHRDAKAALVAIREPKVRAPALLELLLAPVRGDSLHQRLRIVRFQHFRFQPFEPAFMTNNRWLADANV